MSFLTNRRLLLFYFLLGLFFSSCSNTRFLTGDQLLYTGLKKTEISGDVRSKNGKKAKEIIKGVTFSQPNNSFLGTKRILPPTGLWAHNYLKPKKEGKKGNWLYRNFSHEPILISTVNPELKCKQLTSALFGIGYFNATATYELKIKKSNPRKAKIEYKVVLNQPFQINKILLPTPKDSVDQFITNYVENINIDPCDIFNLELIKSHQQTIATQLIEKGYYFFGPNSIEFIADTSKAPYELDLLIRKEPMESKDVYQKYTIGQITILFNWSGIDSATAGKVVVDTVNYDGVTIIGANNYLKYDVLRRCVQFESGEYYSTSRHQGTIKQFNNFGVFRNVKVSFSKADSVQPKLSMFIELLPKDDVSLNLEGYVQSKSTGFAGPGLEFTLTHANIGKAANKLNLGLTGGFEWQWGKGTENNLGSNSYNAGIKTAFTFPKLLIPFMKSDPKNFLLNKTVCDLEFEFLNNVRYYRMTRLSTGLKYQWKRRQKITNIFSPVKINLVNLLETTTNFNNIVDSNIYVKKSFEEQTILGMEYIFIYDNTIRKGNGVFFQGSISTSGNVANVISNLGKAEKPYKVLGNVYSEFFKTTLDVRFYTSTMKKGLVFRIYSGIGYSYGNSTVMPYIEQFYSGGSTSLRGFAARSIGPGNYQPSEFNGIIDQTGDIKFEMNAEYRKPLSDLIHFALFADAGNVWLLNKDENRPGAEFHLNSFTDQFALSGGFGLRFDFNFFVLRTDAGFPIRNTYQTDNSYWLRNFSDIAGGFRFNLAIGYPF